MAGGDTVTAPVDQPAVFSNIESVFYSFSTLYWVGNMSYGYAAPAPLGQFVFVIIIF